ncbi:MAG: hypothetical protein ACR2RV_16360 [Verrucomicrobiales bacterium]
MSTSRRCAGATGAKKVRSISPAQIDRVLAARKVGVSIRKPRTPKANAAIKAIVAVARQLAVDRWQLFTGQTTAQKLGLIYLPEAS